MTVAIFYVMLSFVCVVSLMSCASTTTIEAVNSKGEIDQNVKIYVGGKYFGEGTATLIQKQFILLCLFWS